MLSDGSVVIFEVHVGINRGDVGKIIRHVGKMFIDVGIFKEINKGVLARDTNVIYLWLWLATWGQFFKASGS